MSLQRYFCSSIPVVGETATLDGSEAQHLMKVMRRKVGDEVTLFDGAGQSARAEIVATDRRSADLLILESTHHEKSGREVSLAVALPRGGEANDLVRRAIEAGATRIIPLVAERSVHRSDKKSLEKQRERFRQAALAAMKQSGQNFMAEFDEPTKLLDLKCEEGFAGIFGSTVAGQSLRSFEKENGGSPKKVAIVVGPEGGLTADEEVALQESGFSALSLGTNVYRVETACIALVSFFSSASEDECSK